MCQEKQNFEALAILLGLGIIQCARQDVERTHLEVRLELSQTCKK